MVSTNDLFNDDTTVLDSNNDSNFTVEILESNVSESSIQNDKNDSDSLSENYVEYGGFIDSSDTSYDYLFNESSVENTLSSNETISQVTNADINDLYNVSVETNSLLTLIIFIFLLDKLINTGRRFTRKLSGKGGNDC